MVVVNYTISGRDPCAKYVQESGTNNLLYLRFRVINTLPQGNTLRNSHTEVNHHDDQRGNENLQAAEPHHSGGPRMPLEQGPELRRQGPARRVLLQRQKQALLLRSHLRIPERRPFLRGHDWPERRQRGRIRGRRTRHRMGDAARRRETP